MISKNTQKASPKVILFFTFFISLCLTGSLTGDQPGEAFIDFEDFSPNGGQVTNYYFFNRGIWFQWGWIGGDCSIFNCDTHPPQSGDWQVATPEYSSRYININFPAKSVSCWVTNTDLFLLSSWLYAYSELNGTGNQLDYFLFLFAPGIKLYGSVSSSSGLIKSVVLLTGFPNTQSLDDLTVTYAAPTISLTPEDDIISAGDTLVYDAIIQNTSGHTVTFDLITELIDPGSGPVVKTRIGSNLRWIFINMPRPFSSVGTPCLFR